MKMITFVIASKDLGIEEARRKIFKGITGVEGTKEEFERINEMLKKYPIFKKFDLEDEKCKQSLEE
jgi:hypothetical protein